jgi:hypothetical protein
VPSALHYRDIDESAWSDRGHFTESVSDDNDLDQTGSVESPEPKLADDYLGPSATVEGGGMGPPNCFRQSNHGDVYGRSGTWVRSTMS